MEIGYKPYVDPEVESLIERIHPPRVCIDNDAFQDCTLVKAVSISRALSEAKVAAEKGQVNCCKDLRNSVSKLIEEAGGRIDYAEIVDQESLEPAEVIERPVVFCIAAWFGKVRLIDNMEINIIA